MFLHLHLHLHLHFVPQDEEQVRGLRGLAAAMLQLSQEPDSQISVGGGSGGSLAVGLLPGSGLLPAETQETLRQVGVSVGFVCWYCSSCFLVRWLTVIRSQSPSLHRDPGPRHVYRHTVGINRDWILLDVSYLRSRWCSVFSGPGTQPGGCAVSSMRHCVRYVSHRAGRCACARARLG